MVSGKCDGAWLHRACGCCSRQGVLVRAPRTTLRNTPALRVNVSRAQHSLPSPFGRRGSTRPGESKLEEKLIGANGVAHDPCPPDGNTLTHGAAAARCAGAGVRDACWPFC